MKYRQPGTLLTLLAPSALLPLGFLAYSHGGSVPHFFLHALMGWNAALIVFLLGALIRRRPTRWDGLLPIAMTMYAQVPDIIYVFGPYHRDWMDVFLFHISLDEVLPLALGTLAPLWLVLFITFVATFAGEGDVHFRRIRGS